MADSSTWLDDAIGWIAPRAALRRIKARSALSGTRTYTGAAVGRNTDGWRTSGSSADAEIYAAGARLRDRSRDLIRNNPHAAKAVSVLVNNIIGEGIMPRPKTGDPKKDKKVKALFDRWSRECDADGQLDFAGLQTLAVREMIEGGEVLSRRRPRRARDNMDVPLQIQLLEADFLDPHRIGPLENKNEAVQGVEFDAIGRRVAYWLYPRHPGNVFSILGGNFQSSRIPATEIAHLYEKQRTQARGVPWSAPVIRRIHDVDDYDFAEGIRKKIEASTVAFVTSDDEFEEGLAPGSATQGGARVTDARGNLIEKFAPGLIAYLRGGKDVKFNAPATIGGYEEYKRVTAREIAAGYRVPYELMTGDLSSVNFSSARVGIVDFRRFCGVVQWQIIIPMLLRPWWAWFCQAAYLAGEIDDPEVPVEWDPPRWEAIEPYKDALAELVTLRAGTRSWPEVTASRGRNPDDVLEEIAAWNKQLDQHDMTLDSDPRRTSSAGALQPPPDAGDSADTAPAKSKKGN